MSRKKQSSSGFYWITLISGLALGIALTLGTGQVLGLFMGDLVTNRSESVTYKNPEAQELSFRFFDLLTRGDDIDTSESSPPPRQVSSLEPPREATEPAPVVPPTPIEPEAFETAPPPGATASPELQISEGPRYLLQAGSFRGADKAETLRARILLLGLPVRTSRVEVPGGGVWNRVFVGPYTTKAQTQDAVDRLRAEDIDPLPLRRDS